MIYKKIGIGAAIFVGIIAVALMLWEPIAAHKNVAAPAHDYQARIVRDNFGVPHIFGKRDADVAYGTAYAHAEDDFQTLQEVAAMSRGRMAALNGADAAPIDYVAALLDVDGTVARKYDGLPDDVRAVLDGYAAGLNDYVTAHPAEVKLAKLFPVTGRDVAAGFVLRSPFFYGLNQPIQKILENKPLPKEGGPILSADRPSKGGTPNRTEITISAYNKGPAKRNVATPIGPDPEYNGSNAYAFAPARSPDNKTRLISNSHQPLRGNVAWYELVVHSEEGWDFAGANFPGSPFPFLGHNKHLGWTNTVNRPDLIDIYKLEMNAAQDAYKLDGEWRTLKSKRVWLGIKWGPFTLPVLQTVYRSVHGPVLKNEEGYFALRYASIDDLSLLEQYYRIQKAKNFEEWNAAMAMQAVPSTNFIYADKAGNIALVYNARFPDRKPGFNWRGVLPGDRSDLIWTNPVAWDVVPKLVNPASGYVMNANNTPYIAAGPGDELKPSNFSPLLGVEDDQTNRSRRSIEILEGFDSIGLSEIDQLKYDTAYAKAGYALAWMESIVALDLDGAPQLAKAQKLLAGWDWDLDGKGPADALALMLLRPANGAHYTRVSPPDAREELKKTVDHLTQYFGRIDPPLGEVLRLRQGDIDLPAEGGNDTIRASTLWDVDDDGRLSIYHGDSFIMYVEWNAQGKVASRSVQPFGSATTRPDSPHYTDQMQLYINKKLKPVWFDPVELEKHKISEKWVGVKK